MSIDQQGIHIGVFTMNFYGIILMVGVLVASFVAKKEAVRRKKDPGFIEDALPWLVLGGVLGARLWHIFTPPPSMVENGYTTLYYLTHPLDAISIWKGGLGIPGAVIGGLIALRLYTRYRRQNLLVWADIIAPGLALAQAIGRWGNFVNQELYGAPTDLPWKIYIDPAHRFPEFLNVEYYHPLFLYESLFSLVNMFLLLWIARKFTKQIIPGDVFLVYLMTYPMARFLLDFIRLDASELAGINANQTLMGIVFIAAAFTLYNRHKNANAGKKRRRSKYSSKGKK
ncbi:MAG: prolipoprotein diacylglyceryl transferase [Anaerolineae bacterium]|nr:prolipoprotein diacylglyceryl transferase [Anaerolineae bacterium]